MRSATDNEIRQAWREAGGDFHGPHVEHGYMEERKLLPFLRNLLMVGAERLFRVDPDGSIHLVECEKCAQSGWRPIESAPKGELLLHFPAQANDHYGHGALSAMMQIGYIAQFPHRKPTHWMKRPAPPVEDAPNVKKTIAHHPV